MRLARMLFGIQGLLEALGGGRWADCASECGKLTPLHPRSKSSVGTDARRSC